jgi:hypothetical protein
MFGRLLAPVVLALGALGIASCARTGPDDSNIDDGTKHDAGRPPPVDAGPPIQTSNKLDVLLVVDNSDDLELAHSLLAETLPYLMQRLSAPACVNGLGNVVATTETETEPCPVGVREFAPVTDVHVGVVSTSLGGHGADTCSPASLTWNPQQDDAGHLLSRALDQSTIPTWNNLGFLYWDPLQKAAPPGDSDLPTFDAKLTNIVEGVGDQGCGFESQLESFYRFLVDPAPPQSVVVVNGVATVQGVDDVVLQERADFLRPDSAVAIVVMSDEDDCSTQDGGTSYLSLQAILGNQVYHLPRPRAECATNPADPCCLSCSETPPPSCPADPTCAAGPLDDASDPLNLRCFAQKRRFGVDFLNPTARYVSGLSDGEVVGRDGTSAPNPLFSTGRAPELVVFTAIVGVPWQDVAAYPSALELGFLPGSEIDWPIVIGDPENFVAPGDPLMIASIDPRTGNNPATGAALEPPDSPLGANPINGHERNIPTRDDLQPTCIYPRPMPKDCTNASNNCACIGTNIDTNPLCQAPDGSYGPIQYANRALPGIRELEVVKGLGDRGVAASICAANTTDTGGATFGYKPAIDAMLRALRGRLL